MKCPACSQSDTSVTDSRTTREGREIRRRRLCETCGYRFTTYERPDERPLFIVKRDKRREAFSRQKVERGMIKACEKLDIPNERLLEAVSRVTKRVFDLNVEEVASDTVGRYVMEELYDLDEVAYIRFASVYLRFQNISDFTRHVEDLRRKRENERQVALPVVSEGALPSAPAVPPGGVLPVPLSPTVNPKPNAGKDRRIPKPRRS